MADIWLPLLIVLLLTLFLFTFHRRNRNLPPTLPLPLNNIDLLSSLSRHSLLRLSQSLGPIFSLRFKFRLVVVISSSSLAENCISQNDITLAPYGPRWHSLRKIFTSIRLNSISCIMSDAVAGLVRGIAQTGSVVVLRPLVRKMMYEILMRILTGERGEFALIMDTIDEASKHLKEFNLANFFPLQRSPDLRQNETAADELLQRILDDRRRSEVVEREDNVIDNLLFYDDETIKGIVLAMLSGGTDTTPANIEWAMTLLLNNPSILAKAKSEIDNQVGQHRAVNQSDLPNLPYLESIISETLRLYPPRPHLVLHSSQDCTVAGYRIPRDTTVIVNAWAIHRDPSVWDEPLRFRPERFEGRDANVYEFMPFGIGRRACPGAGLGKNVAGLALASLIQCFDWGRCGEEEVDLSEGGGFVMTKAMPLEAVCKARPVVSYVYA